MLCAQLKPPSWQPTICCYCCCWWASTAIPGRPGPPTIWFKPLLWAYCYLSVMNYDWASEMCLFYAMAGYSHWRPSGYSRHLSDMKCTVMIWRSWVQTPVGLNLGCVGLLSQVVFELNILYVEEHTGTDIDLEHAPENTWCCSILILYVHSIKSVYFEYKCTDITAMLRSQYKQGGKEQFESVHSIHQVLL